MQRNYNPLKRAAPGTSPSVPQNVQSFPVQDAQHLQNQPDPQYYDWDQAGNFKTPELPGFEVNDFAQNAFNQGMLGNGQMTNQGSLAPGTGELVRRNANQQLARPTRGGWDGTSIEPPASGWVYDDDEELAVKALEAKREALSKKRQIPPFVQKLSSFLDELRNTDLIRWSDDGLSFIVLDEEEFAKTLIPELFKHNNYASFVRQLNMYGFHKKVGLSDNSMKASENKRKTPSRYANAYFRRGRPELLWLIQKPKNPPPGKRGPDMKGEMDDDTIEINSWPMAQPVDNGDGTSKDLVTISRNDWDEIRQDVVGLKKQNQLISSVLASMRRQNQDAQQQIQQMHERHESSINAIMTFLATFYNRSLEGQTPGNIGDMFSGGIGQGHHQSGNIVDMSDMPDIPEMQLNFPSRNTRSRRRLALLPAPESGSITSLANSAQNTPAPQMQSISQQEVTPSRPIQSPPPKVELQDTPNTLSDVPDIMSIINAANASSPANNSGNNFDFNSALEHMQTADGNTPLTNQQKTDVLQRMSKEASGSTTAPSPIDVAVEQQLAPSKSPTYGSPGNQLAFDPQPPNLDNILNIEPSLDYVHKLQEEQAKKVQDLAQRLGPLSPNGAIPGLHDSNTPQPGEWSLEDWLNNSYFPEDTGEGAIPQPDSNNANFNPDNSAGDLGLGENSFQNEEDNGRVQSLSSRGVSPATVATVESAEPEGNGRPDSPRKRRKTRN